MKDSGLSEIEIEEALRKRIANKYQNIQLAGELCKREFGLDLFEECDPKEVEKLRLTFEKRPPITHNLGIVDRKYLEKARSGELKGRDVRVTVQEVESAIKLLIQVLEKLHSRLFHPR